MPHITPISNTIVTTEAVSALFWLFLGLAGPQWGAREVEVTAKGSDIVIALDISQSMLVGDVAPTRLDAVKTELGAFLNRLEDSRVGLVFFSGMAAVQNPLTLEDNRNFLYVFDV